MDHFGIGGALMAQARTYFQASRRTGRTTSLVDSLKNGDRVVFLTRREGDRVKRLCQERGVKIEIIVSPPSGLDRLFCGATPSGDERTIFDHNWVEKFYENALTGAANDIDHLQKQLSGFGAPHRETRRAALEQSKFGYYEGAR